MAIFEPSKMLTHTTTAGAATNTLTLLSPALASTFVLFAGLQTLLSTTSIFVLLRFYILSLHSINISRLLLLHTLKASWIFTVNSFYLSRLVLINSWYASRMLLIHSYFASTIVAKISRWGFWTWWRLMRPLREKIFFEFMTFILGGGNQILLLVLWPGWWVIGAGFGGIWLALG